MKQGESTTATRACGKSVCWWDGEYEGECELPEGHEGDHFDGLSWFNDDSEPTDAANITPNALPHGLPPTAEHNREHR